MATASQKVFETVELLEIILFKLPTKSLLLSQRVSKHCKSVIEKSKMLQEALFLRPIRIDDKMLIYLPNFCGGSEGRAKGTWILPGDKFASNIVIFSNPLVQPLIQAMAELNSKRKGLFMSKLHRSWRYPEASWRRMLLTQPSMKSRLGYYEEPCDMNTYIATPKTFDTGRTSLNELMTWLIAELKCKKGDFKGWAEFDAMHELLTLKDNSDLELVGQKNGSDSDSEEDDSGDEDSEDVGDDAEGSDDDAEGRYTSRVMGLLKG